MGLPLNLQYQFVLESDVRPEAIIEISKKIATQYKDLTAAFATSDQIASYLIRGLHENRVRVPDDFSVVGFDNLMISTQITPQLTTISQDLEQKASLSVDVLFRQMKTPGSPTESLILDVELIERESVASI
jgi:LacI family transcriptional regulator